jgi:hypothetical protein
MRPLRLIPVRRTAAVAMSGAAFAAFAALAAAPSMAGAASPPSAQSEYQASIKAATSQGVHFSSNAAQGGVSITVTGDTGATSGAQTLTVKKGSLTEHVSAMVVGSTGYVKGNATALHNVIGLTNAQSKKYAGTWLSFPTSNAGLAQLVSGLLNSQVASELQMTGPYSYGKATTAGGKHALVIHGSVSTQSGTSVPVDLYVSASGAPLPIQEVTNPGTSGGSTALHGTVSFSRWGQKTSLKAPAKSFSLLKLAPPSTSGATSTTGG